MWRTEWEGFHLRRPRVFLLVHVKDRLPDHTDDRTASPSMPVTGTASPPPFPSSSPPEVDIQHPAADDEGPQLPGR
ncbi:hypothetical protein Taro_003213 [Colocasia esculenta]|uniref:Uncharacterized protein n=1 Tax=Colocasia esculenta TaxID=4460 RepID=A0A843TKX1_COLES|nr:hypothetical protein [Colocasia esculenta]